MAAAKAIRRIDDFLLDELILSIDQFDIDCAAKRRGKVKRSLGQVSFEPNRFARSIGLPVLMEIDFSSGSSARYRWKEAIILGKGSLIGVNEKRKSINTVIKKIKFFEIFSILFVRNKLKALFKTDLNRAF